MTVTERRIVFQDWYETEYSKTGWDSHGWVFSDSGELIYSDWIVVEHIKNDKYYNPIFGIAEKQTEMN
jgi:hypothetical protein